MVASACKLSRGFSVAEVEALAVLKGLVRAVLETDASMVVELIRSKDVVLFELGYNFITVQRIQLLEEEIELLTHEVSFDIRYTDVKWVGHVQAVILGPN
ncbi:hypothetical protein LWI29_010619 [Acer saccharum]|uniref:Uncharacterized protein n=1 Tax=Acer saccharum TaxID=4024 RepID=A0AA39SLV1_ACESA|nr:hypothetical protein LWI29_010619 [Acer saccharum]